MQFYRLQLRSRPLHHVISLLDRPMSDQRSSMRCPSTNSDIIIRIEFGLHCCFPRRLYFTLWLRPG